MRDLRNSPQRFFIYFRMPEACFDEILELIKEDITKQDTKYREAISAEERLAITLRLVPMFCICSHLILQNPLYQNYF